MNDKTDIGKVQVEGAHGAVNAPAELAFLVPLVDKIRAVEIKFDGHDGAVSAAPALAPESDNRLKALETALAVLKADRASAAAALEARLSALESRFAEPVERPRPRETAAPESKLELTAHSASRSVPAAALAIALLVITHALVVFAFDASTVVLRLASIAIPMAVAIWATHGRAVRASREAALALVVAVGAVLAMSYTTSVHEGTGILPENIREWRETLEYTLSIALSWFTGVLISAAAQLRSRGGGAESAIRLVQAIGLMIARLLVKGPLLKEKLDTTTKVVASVMPLVTAISALIAGLKSAFG